MRCTTLVLPLVLLSSLSNAAADTRTIFSSPSTGVMNWVTSPANYAYGWQENSMLMSSQRYYFVLSITDVNTPNNWLRLPFISRTGSNMVYVQVAFAVRACSAYPNQANVHTCNQYINMYFYSANSDFATVYPNGTANPPWASYTLVGKLVPNTPWVNDVIYDIKTLQLPASSLNGFYLAFQDTGSCSGIANITVFYYTCPTTAALLASYPQTASASDVYRFVSVTGSCVSQASLVGSAAPTLQCLSDGTWQLGSLPSSDATLACQCNPGYQPNAAFTACTACGPNTFKDSTLRTCVACPAMSTAVGSANTACSCLSGYYRAANDPSSFQCTSVPTVPLNLAVYATSSTGAQLSWQAPVNFGGRQDGYYTVTTVSSNVISGSSLYSATYCGSAGNAVVTATSYYVSNLQAAASYYFLVCACNGVSLQAATANCAATSLPTVPQNTSVGLTSTAQSNNLHSTATAAMLIVNNSAGGDSNSTVVVAVVTTVTVVVAITAIGLLLYFMRKRISEKMPCFEKSKPFVDHRDTHRSDSQLYPNDASGRNDSPLPSPIYAHSMQAQVSGRYGQNVSDAFSANFASAGGQANRELQLANNRASNSFSATSSAMNSSAVRTSITQVSNATSDTSRNGLISPPTLVSNGQKPNAATDSHTYSFTIPMEPCAAPGSAQNSVSISSAFENVFGSPPSSFSHASRTIEGIAANPNLKSSDTMRYVVARTDLPTGTKIGTNANSKANASANRNECNNEAQTALPYISTDPAVFGYGTSNNTSGLSSMRNYADPVLLTHEIAVKNIKVERVIGSGEFGEVCKGRLIKRLVDGSVVDKDVALKTLKSGANIVSRGEFLSEASIMCMFEHSNILRLEGVVTRADPIMIVSEFMENGSLDDFLRRNECKLSNYTLIQMLQGVACGMDYLASKNYVHRDLAARNILVDRNFVCKIGDFGLSRQTVLVNDTSSCCYVTRGGKIPVRWTAPEAILFRKFTTSSDCWSFGIVMWEVISYGTRPYWDWSNNDVLQLVDCGYRLPPPYNCPEVAYNTMLLCWRSDRHLRPSFQNIFVALSTWLNNPDILNRIAYENPQIAGVPDDFEPTTITTAHLQLQTNLSSVAASLVSDVVPLPLSVREWLATSDLAELSVHFEQSQIVEMNTVLSLSVKDLVNLGVQKELQLKRLVGSIQSLQLFRKFYRRRGGLVSSQSNDRTASPYLTDADGAECVDMFSRLLKRTLAASQLNANALQENAASSYSDASSTDLSSIYGGMVCNDSALLCDGRAKSAQEAKNQPVQLVPDRQPATLPSNV